MDEDGGRMDEDGDKTDENVDGTGKGVIGDGRDGDGMAGGGKIAAAGDVAGLGAARLMMVELEGEGGRTIMVAWHLRSGMAMSRG